MSIAWIATAGCCWCATLPLGDAILGEMISHVHIGITDFDRAFVFYATVLPVLGLELSCYGAYFRDPDGNKLCVCCHQPEPAR